MLGSVCFLGGFFFQVECIMGSVPFLSPPQGGRNFTDVISVDGCLCPLFVLATWTVAVVFAQGRSAYELGA